MEQRKRLRLPVDHPDHYSAVLLLRRRNVGKQQLWLRLRQLQKQRLLLLRAGKHGGGALYAPLLLFIIGMTGHFPASKPWTSSHASWWISSGERMAPPLAQSIIRQPQKPATWRALSRHWRR